MRICEVWQWLSVKADGDSENCSAGRWIVGVWLQEWTDCTNERSICMKRTAVIKQVMESNREADWFL